MLFIHIFFSTHRKCTFLMSRRAKYNDRWARNKTQKQVGRYNYLGTFYTILYHNIIRARGVYVLRVIGLGCVLPLGYTRTFACDVSIFWAFPFYLPNGFASSKGCGTVHRVRVGVMPLLFFITLSFVSIHFHCGFRSICSVAQQWLPNLFGLTEFGEKNIHV